MVKYFPLFSNLKTGHAHIVSYLNFYLQNCKQPIVKHYLCQELFKTEDYRLLRETINLNFN